MPQPLCEALLAKIDEQAERTSHLIRLIPGDALHAKPIAGQSTTGDLLGHLLECMAGFCAVLAAVRPKLSIEFAGLRTLPVNHCCECVEALDRIETYRRAIASGFALLSDDDLATPIPTVFVPDGEPLLTLILGNLEHVINHKHQLFTYLKLMGIDAGTPDLYRFRGSPGSSPHNRNV